MYQSLTFYHSLMRWLVLISLVYAIVRAWCGYALNKPFSKADNAIRHWTATIAHIQLLIGMVFYMESPVVKYFWKHTGDAIDNTDALFFSVIHISLMLTAVVILTIGSGRAKRQTADKDKFSTMLLWFAIALGIICIAIPWPFSPLAARPYFRY